jgi:hypothetical protein
LLFCLHQPRNLRARATFEVKGVPVPEISSANRFNREIRTGILVIFLALVATLPALPSKTEASYNFTVEKGIITLTDAQSGKVLSKAPLSAWGVTDHPTQDRLRHLALDCAAACVAGHGSREHSVDPNSPVHSMEEAAKAQAVTATFEGDFFFFIKRDSTRTDRYEALILRGNASSARAIH